MLPKISPPALDIEALVDNAPPAQEPASPARPSLLSRLFGSSGARQQQERNITERRREFISGTVPSAPSEEQRLLQLQINTEAAEQMMVISQIETEIADLDARKAAAETALAQSHQRARALEQASPQASARPESGAPLEEAHHHRQTSLHFYTFSRCSSNKQRTNAVRMIAAARIRHIAARTAARNNAERINVRQQSGKSA
jgi:hypothetical protein